MNSYSSEDTYIVRIIEKEEGTRAEKLSELEELLRSNENTEIKFVIKPIAAITAKIYSRELVDELRSKGYELIPQEKKKMIEGGVNE